MCRGPAKADARTERRRYRSLAAVACAALFCAGALHWDVNCAVCDRETGPGRSYLCGGKLVTVDPGAGEVETALVVGVREVRDAMAADATGEGEQVPDLLRARGRARATLEPGLFQVGVASDQGLLENRSGDGEKGTLVEYGLALRWA
jgi:hypothetical protein